MSFVDGTHNFSFLIYVYYKDFNIRYITLLQGGGKLEIKPLGPAWYNSAKPAQLCLC